MKKIFLFCILALPVTITCFAQFNQTESLTIVTYYPSPSGVYRSLRLNPTDEPTDAVDRGVMYYNQTENVIKYRNDTSWVNMASGGGGYLTQQSGSGRIYFANTSSNVGIGTTDPTQKLDVEGNIQASGNLMISGNISASGNLSVSKDITVNGKMKVSGDVCLTNGICLSQLSFNAVCGSASKAYAYTSTSYGGDSFCGSGTPSPSSPAFPAQGVTVSWTCPAINGNPISCMASRGAAPVNGVCGAAATTYPYSATAFSGALCNAGTASPASPVFPAKGDSSSWSCLGTNGGSSPSCTASRSNPASLVNNQHSEADCNAVGGNVVASDVSYNQCRFNAASCPGGWTQYKSFGRFGGNSCSSCCSSCTTSQGSWGNPGTSVPSCQYGRCGDSDGCTCCTDAGPGTCIAVISQIGCY
jgi:hypothetical protein